jgi:uncharacterized protein (UPF0332 family)
MGSSSGKGRWTNPAFETCLKSRKIVKFPRARRLISKELLSARQDLEEARDRLAHGKWKYATINAYYAIFHAARALLYFQGFRERSHYCLLIALEALYVQRKLLEVRFVDSFKETMTLRENADYLGTFSREGAEMSIRNAQQFIEAAESLLR